MAKQRLRGGMTPSLHSSGRWRITIPANLTETSRRETKYFDSRAEAMGERALMLERAAEYGASGGVIVSRDDAKSIEVMKTILKPFGASPLSIVKEWVAAKGRDQASCAHLVSMYLDQIPVSWNNAHKRRVLRITSLFVEHFGDNVASSIDPIEIDRWLCSLGTSDHSYNGNLRCLQPVYTYGLRMKLISDNPMTALRQRKLKTHTINVLNYDQAQALIDACVDYSHDQSIRVKDRANASSPQARLSVAIMLFAGIRPAELTRMTWDDVFIDRNVLRVTASASKTNRIRLVQIEHNLMAFIQSVPEYERRGSIIPARWVSCWKAIRKGAGISHLNDVCRHSFASYWLAKYESMDGLKMRLGHSTQQTTLDHYATAVHQDEAELYFRIGL